MHENLPCHVGGGCSLCCELLANWDKKSFERLEREQPEALMNFKAVRVRGEMAHNIYYVLPADFETAEITFASVIQITIMVQMMKLKWPDFEKRRCVFLDEQNRCSVYEYRPKICRDYPFPGEPCLYFEEINP